MKKSKDSFKMMKTLKLKNNFKNILTFKIKFKIKKIKKLKIKINNKKNLFANKVAKRKMKGKDKN